MGFKSILKWSAIGVAGAAVAGGAVITYQVRQRPVPNAYYVALGSSFAAGLGLGNRVPGSPIVSQRSINGYPQQLARMLNVPSFTDLSSSGSTVQHVLHGGQMGLGPQVDALGPDTKLVTLTAGGNDVGYVGDLIMMAYRNRGGVIGFLATSFSKETKSVGTRNFAALETNLTATLREINRRSPNAQIIVVTYPAILPVKGTCPKVGVTADQADLMRAVGDRLAAVTRSVAAHANVAVVDMATLSVGHDPCSAEPWVNGSPGQHGADFHPTLAGAEVTAQAIAPVVLPKT